MRVDLYCRAMRHVRGARQAFNSCSLSTLHRQRHAQRMKKLLYLLFILATTNDGVRAQDQSRINTDSLLSHVQTLSSDKYGGRLAGSESGLMAQRYLVKAFSDTGLQTCDGRYRHEFALRSRQGEVKGGNILGLINGISESDDVIVLSAHFDHLGVRGESIYNGADDNASGTGALIEMAAYFLENPPAHSILIAAFDGEEGGLQGSQAFLRNPCLDLDRISINVNMDMISRSESSELYVSGTYHYPLLRELLENIDVPADLTLLFGHDTPGTGSDDWTMASDQGPFFQRGIPHLFFGVEDHAGYHTPGDDFENITPSFYVDAVELILDVIIEVDENMGVVTALK